MELNTSVVYLPSTIKCVQFSKRADVQCVTEMQYLFLAQEQTVVKTLVKNDNELHLLTLDNATYAVPGGKMGTSNQSTT